MLSVGLLLAVTGPAASASASQCPAQALGGYFSNTFLDATPSSNCPWQNLLFCNVASLQALSGN